MLPNLGMLLIDFMNFYMNFDYTGTQIKPFKVDDPLSDAMPYLKIMQSDARQCMYIVDPLNIQNNVSRSAQKFYILRVSLYKIR